MSAQPVNSSPTDRDYDPGPDPGAISAALPQEYRAVFKDEYDAAVDAAHDFTRYKALRDLVQLWRLRAVAYAKPGYEKAFRPAEERRDGEFHVPPGFEGLAGQ